MRSRHPSSVPPPPHDDRRMRRQFLLLGLLLAVPMQLGFAGINWFQGIPREALFDLLSAVILLTVPVLINLRHDKAAHRVVSAVILLVEAYTLAFPQHGLRSGTMGFYIMPFVFFYLNGLRDGLIFSLIMMGFAVAVIFNLSQYDTTFDVAFQLRFGTSLSILTILAYFQERFRRQATSDLLAMDGRMDLATSQLQTLEGLVPVCSYCKQVKNDDGYWQTLEQFLKTNTTANISTALCEPCAQKIHSSAEIPVPAEVLLPNMETVRRTAHNDRQRFVSGIGFAAAAVVVAFSVFDLKDGRFLTGAMQIILAIALGAVGIFARKEQNPRWLYPTVISLYLAILAQPYLLGPPDNGEILWFFLVPICAFFLLGVVKGLLVSIGAGIFAMVGLYGLLGPSPQLYDREFMLFFATLYLFVTGLALIVTKTSNAFRDRVQRRIEELTAMYESIRTFKGMVPVCHQCKSILDDEGFWTTLETYLEAHTDLKLSHSICQSCLKREMPDIYKEMIADGELETLS